MQVDLGLSKFALTSVSLNAKYFVSIQKMIGAKRYFSHWDAPCQNKNFRVGKTGCFQSTNEKSQDRPGVFGPGMEILVGRAELSCLLRQFMYLEWFVEQSVSWTGSSLCRSTKK